MRNPLKWLQILRKRIKRDRYITGFDYTLGAIARGEKTPLVLDAEQCTEPRNEFDVGMNAGINYAIQRKLVKDDRI